MAKRKMTFYRRYCEECGQLIESKRPDVFLCKECSAALTREKRAARKNKKTFRRTQRLIDEQWDEEQ